MTSIPKPKPHKHVEHSGPTTKVRWRRPRIEQSWKYGRLAREQPYLLAHTVQVIDDRNNGTRVISEEHVEVEASGPRGGKHWVPCDAKALEALDE